MASLRTQQALARLADLTPRQIVAELDRYIVGQADAKKAVAIALRNRWRRQQAPESIRDEISPAIVSACRTMSAAPSCVLAARARAAASA